MMRRTSKTVQEAVDKLRLPAVVCVRTCGSVHWEPQFICCQLASLTALVSITTLDLQDFLYYKIKTPRLYFWLAEVLARCPALERLNLRSNMIGDCGTERLAGALAQCTVLTHLNLRCNRLRAAGLLAHCTALAYLDLSDNPHFGPDGAASLAGVLAQCPALAHLDLKDNHVGKHGVEKFAGVLPQCTALTHLNLTAMRGREPCRSASAVHRADSPQSQLQ